MKGRLSRACTVCGRITQEGNRCPQHPKVKISARPHRRMRAQVLAQEHHCWICGKPGSNDDPLTYDHVIARTDGGDNSRANARAAHASCNSRRGATRIPCDTCPTPTRCNDIRQCQPPSDHLDRTQRISSHRIAQQPLPQRGPHETHEHPDTIEHLPWIGPTLIVLCGPIASGKTTFARSQWPGHHVSVDNIRATLGPLADTDTLAEGYALAYEEAYRHLLRLERVIFDSTATSYTVRRNLLLRAQAAHASAHLILLDTPLDVARQRNSAREHPVPDDIVSLVERLHTDSRQQAASEPWASLTILDPQTLTFPSTPLQA